MDDYAIEEAWNMLLSLKGDDSDDEEEEDVSSGGDDEAKKKTKVNNNLKKVKDLFDTFDVDGNKSIDVDELSEGLLDLKILMNKRQIKKFTQQMDLDNDGFVR